jgi:hypothetical protein
LGLALNEIQRILLRLLPYAADVIPEPHAKAHVRNPEHFRSESRTDELTSGRSSFSILGFILRPVGEVQEVISHSCSILRVEIGINLVKDVEWCWVCGLDGEDEGKTAKTWS